MATTPKTIRVTATTGLPELLREAAETPVILERGDERFRLSRADDRSAAYDPDKVRAGLRKFAGLISPEDAERLKASIYRGRDEGTRPLERP